MSRIKEEYTRTGDAAAAVGARHWPVGPGGDRRRADHVRGLRRVHDGRSSATIKAIGFSLAAGVLFDAFVVRLTLFLGGDVPGSAAASGITPTGSPGGSPTSTSRGSGSSTSSPRESSLPLAPRSGRDRGSAGGPARHQFAGLGQRNPVMQVGQDGRDVGEGSRDPLENGKRMASHDGREGICRPRVRCSRLHDRGIQAAAERIACRGHADRLKRADPAVGEQVGYEARARRMVGLQAHGVHDIGRGGCVGERAGLGCHRPRAATPRTRACPRQARPSATAAWAGATLATTRSTSGCAAASSALAKASPMPSMQQAARALSWRVVATAVTVNSSERGEQARAGAQPPSFLRAGAHDPTRIRSGIQSPPGFPLGAELKRGLIGCQGVMYR